MKFTDLGDKGPQFKLQGVAEAGLKFNGGFPDVDHMNGPRGINLPSAPTKKFFTDKKQWERAVNDINSSKYDDNSEYTGQTGRSTVSIDGREWARWSDAQQKGYIELSSMSEQGVAEMDSQGYTGSRDNKSKSTYGSRDDYELGHEKEYTAKAITPGQTTKKATDILNKAFNNADVDEASLASMRDYFSQPDNNTVAVDNEYGAPERKKPANVPSEIQIIINKMYRVGKITPQELDVLKRFQAKTGINVGLKIKEASNAYAIGMASAMKSTGDKPPLKKSTINKAHKIARAIEKDE